jgi:membrane protein DedA with SNARE-associated domain
MLHKGLPACGVLARVVPEEKFRLVKALQHRGHVVGMCGVVYRPGHRLAHRLSCLLAPGNASPDGQGSASWLQWMEEQFLSALLVYGYPILGTILLLGAIGLPLPTGLSAAVAGSLSALGRMDWLTAGAIAIIASLLGDMVPYAMGRVGSERLLRRWGPWLGYLPARQARAEALFERWGGLTILVTRTLISQLSTIVSLLAGLHRYRIAAFLTFDLVGRAIWTAAYMGLGYLLAGSLDAATEFLKNLTGLLLSSTALAASAALAWSTHDEGRGIAP